MDSAPQRPSPEYARSSACWCCDVACQGPALTLMWPRCAQAFRCRDWATLAERSHWRMTATTCYDMLRHNLLQLKDSKRLKVSAGVQFQRLAGSAPAGTPRRRHPAAARALKRPRTAAQARLRRRPKPGPGPEPNSDPNLGSGQRASADWLALARLRPLMSTVLQSIQLRSCTMPTRSEEGSAWVPAHNRARFAIEKKSMVSRTQAPRNQKHIEIQRDRKSSVYDS